MNLTIIIANLKKINLAIFNKSHTYQYRKEKAFFTHSISR